MISTVTIICAILTFIIILLTAYDRNNKMIVICLISIALTVLSTLL